MATIPIRIHPITLLRENIETENDSRACYEYNINTWCKMKRLRIKIISPLLMLLILLPTGGDVSFRTPCFNAIAQPHSFSLITWSLNKLSTGMITRLQHNDDYAKLSENERLELVRNYLLLGEKRGYLDFRMMWLDGETDETAIAEKQSTAEQLSLVIAAMDPDKDTVQNIISEKLEDILQEEGISLMPGLIIPPVTFSFEKLPFLLIISPRDKIIMQDTHTLHPDLTLSEIEDVEQRLETLGYSALVERVGGISTYPSMIPNTASAHFIFSTVAHEWMHQYLFFHALGRNYGDSYEMRIINETVADMIGSELGTQMVNCIYGNNDNSVLNTPPTDTFDFDREMRNIRLTADLYLQEGKVEEAEQYMEEQRQYLEDNGYYIRKINQAYFAWHGSYADSPSSVSPVGAQLQEIREQCDSLKAFVKIVSGIARPSDLNNLIG